MKLHYTTFIDYSHRITKQDMVDDACTENHSHEEVIITVAIDVGGNFVDFKDLKKAVEEILLKFRGNNLTDVCGLETTEEFATYIGKLISADYGHPTEVNIQETPRYGVTYVSS